MTSAPREPRLTVGIATYNGRKLLEVALPSLRKQTLSEFRLVVVDDASTDGTADWVRAYWPDAHLIIHERNLGVTAALNSCLRTARSELIALFNNDIELDPNCLAELVSALDCYPDSSWAAAKLLNFEQRDLIDGAGDVYTWAGTAGRRGHGELDRGQYDAARPIFGACAGAAIYRSSALERVGLFDEDFFALYEDVDWNLRAQLAGLSCRYAPAAVAYHKGSTTIGRGLTDFSRYHMWRNALWILAKDMPLDALLRHRGELIRGQSAILRSAIREHKLQIWMKAVLAALLGMPKAVRKRRMVQRTRRIDLHRLDAMVGVDGGTEA
jgi:GT2 family glycosyltransferase